MARALMLAGRTLAAPNVLKVGWSKGQRFAASDDPDRTDPSLFVWQDPSFLFKKNPVKARLRTTVEELVLKKHRIAGYREGKSFARVVHNVLDEEDCAQLLKQVNDKGFTPALLNIGGGIQQFAPDIRNGLRVIIDSPRLAQYLFEVIRPNLPNVIEEGEGGGGYQKLVELNESCRFLCYTPSDQFHAHFDGSYCRPSHHQNSGDVSRVTVQLYLHDVPWENGGATTFLSKRRRRSGGGENKLADMKREERTKEHTQQKPKEVTEVGFNPRAGSALLFTQDLLHEGSLLLRGLKYSMRTEAMYRGCDEDRVPF
eukprot:CAMPEP_0181296248 /NCGR_PEP_ID=MMETSP1101-20121128/4596_1 /TAXON_ID=46948 /ORGANISM="Rhodomonas abbreviata, Strain Caron Lab Isolate" /LENGTH=312 /DNA_ID=CAMNT_0023401087 /DNA_START=102 /DNA_END=1040 /DNA_ORIENTATION=-